MSRDKELLDDLRQRLNWLHADPSSTRARADLALYIAEIRERIPA